MCLWSKFELGLLGASFISMSKKGNKAINKFPRASIFFSWFLWILSPILMQDLSFFIFLKLLQMAAYRTQRRYFLTAWTMRTERFAIDTSCLCDLLECHRHGLCTAGDATTSYSRWVTWFWHIGDIRNGALPMALIILLNDPADHRIMIIISPLKFLQVNQRYGIHTVVINDDTKSSITMGVWCSRVLLFKLVILTYTRFQNFWDWDILAAPLSRKCV